MRQSRKKLEMILIMLDCLIEKRIMEYQELINTLNEDDDEYVDSCTYEENKYQIWSKLKLKRTSWCPYILIRKLIVHMVNHGYH